MTARRRKPRPNNPFKRKRRGGACDDFDFIEGWMAGGGDKQ